MVKILANAPAPASPWGSAAGAGVHERATGPSAGLTHMLRRLPGDAVSTAGFAGMADVRGQADVKAAPPRDTAAV
jgi:hypothetical protein